MAEEIELKLAMTPEAMDRLDGLKLVNGLKPSDRKHRKLLSTYFDTPDFALRRNGMVLRIRKVGQKRIQTLKISGSPPKKGRTEIAAADGAITHWRQEYECEVEGDNPDLTRISHTRFNRLIGCGSKAKNLKAVFISEIYRRSFLLKDKTTSMEVVLDRGVLRAGSKTETVCEAELELIAGPVDILPKTALTLPEDILFRLEQKTKSARGYDLQKPMVSLPRKSAKARLSSAMTAEDALRTILNACISQMRSNESVILSGENPDGVHQFRVAVRRLRATLLLFKDLRSNSQRQTFEADLSWLQQVVGVARDWDVFLGETIGPLNAKFPEDGGLRRVAAASTAARREANGNAREALNDARYARLLLRLELLRASSAGIGDTRKTKFWPGLKPISDLANTILEKRYRKLIEIEKQSDEANEASLHRVRIAAKKLRYAIEFFPDLYDSKMTKSYLKRVISLQDTLGALNDGTTAQNLTVELEVRMKTAGRRRDVRIALGKILGWHARRASSDLEGFEVAWAGFSKAAPFWSKA